MPKDARGRLISDPFEHRVTKDGRVLVSRGGVVVVTVAGSAAKRLVTALAAAPGEAETQQLLARATGSYRRGNERSR